MSGFVTIGIPQGAIETFLQSLGFRQVKDVGVNELKSAYFTGKNAAHKVVGGYGIVIGKV